MNASKPIESKLGTVEEQGFWNACIGETTELEAFLDRGASPNHVFKGRCGVQPLHIAVAVTIDRVGHETDRRSSFDLAKLLVAAGADVNAPDDFGNTPLMFAVLFGDRHTIQCLILAGASVSKRNKEGWSSVSMASLIPHTGECEWLLALAGFDARFQMLLGSLPQSSSSPIHRSFFSSSICELHLLPMIGPFLKYLPGHPPLLSLAERRNWAHCSVELLESQATDSGLLVGVILYARYMQRATCPWSNDTFIPSRNAIVRLVDLSRSLHPIVSKSAIQCLGNLCAEGGPEPRLVGEAGGLDVMIASIKKGGDPEIVRKAIIGLGNLCLESTSYRDTLVKYLDDLLVPLLDGFQTSLPVLFKPELGWFLCVLAQSEPHLPWPVARCLLPAFECVLRVTKDGDDIDNSSYALAGINSLLLSKKVADVPEEEEKLDDVLAAGIAHLLIPNMLPTAKNHNRRSPPALSIFSLLLRHRPEKMVPMVSMYRDDLLPTLSHLLATAFQDEKINVLLSLRRLVANHILFPDICLSLIHDLGQYIGNLRYLVKMPTPTLTTEAILFMCDVLSLSFRKAPSALLELEGTAFEILVFNILIPADKSLWHQTAPVLARLLQCAQEHPSTLGIARVGLDESLRTILVEMGDADCVDDEHQAVFKDWVKFCNESEK